MAVSATVPDPAGVTVSTLRGKFADNHAWNLDPSRPAIIVGTVDMIGSRMLFAGYGGLSLAVVYAAVALSGFRGLWGHVNQAALVVAGVLGFAISGLAIFSAVYKVPSPFNTVTLWFIGWAVVGVIILVALVAQNKFRLSAAAAGALTTSEEEAGQMDTGVAPPGEVVRPEF